MRLGAAAVYLIVAILLGGSELRGEDRNEIAGHVRGTTPWLRAAVAKGVATSPTFRLLVATLDASDVIVYLMPLHRDRRVGTMQGYVPHRVRTAGSFRYMTVAIRHVGSDERALPIIAHELQHVNEIAANPRAGRDESVENVVGRISRLGCDVGACYETDQALHVEAAVQNEVSVARRRDPGGTRMRDGRAGIVNGDCRGSTSDSVGSGSRSPSR